MLITLSPSKGQDFENSPLTKTHSLPEQLTQSKQLVKTLKKHKTTEIMELMKVSENIAQLNYDRFQEFKTPFNLQNSKQALFAFKGDVYSGIHTNTMSQHDFEYAQNHLRILSGLYGCLKPLDLIQAYRLEMKTKLKTSTAENLYQFWNDSITKNLNLDIESTGSEFLINLASNEYWKSVKPKSLNAKVIQVAFKEEKQGKSRIIAIFAKKARGMMTDYIIRNQIKQPNGLKDFDYEGYKYQVKDSTESQFIFTRHQPKPKSK